MKLRYRHSGCLAPKPAFMRQHLRSEANPSSPLFSPAEAIRTEADEAGSHPDLAELAAQFSAHGGGGLSPEHSTDLALEVVLNEIVEQACLATGATGAAIVLWRDKELVCRASSGTTAPDLGSRLDPSSGISGQCIRTYRTQSCDDVHFDPRADLEASLRLGIRSVLAMPILYRENLLGVFELFSSRPSAFGERDERTLEALVTRTLANLERAARPVATSDETSAAVPRDAANEILADGIPPDKDDEEMARSAASVSGGGPDFLTLMLGAAVLLCAVMLGVLVGRHFGMPGMGQRARASTATPANNGLATPGASDAPATGTPAASPSDSQLVAQTLQSSVAHTSTDIGAAPGGLVISENGKEIFRQGPGQSASRQRFAQARSGDLHSRPAASAQPRPIQAASVQAAPSQLRSVQPVSEPHDGGQTATAVSSAAPEPIMQKAASIQPVTDLELAPAEAEASLLNRVEPEYPDDARQQNIQGEVVLEIHIATDGAVDGVDVVSGPQQLVQPSADAVRQWRFKPHLVNGQAVRTQTRVALSFRLPG